MGRETIGDMNENGELFAEFCAFSDLVIRGTVFKHTDIHKATWISPDGHTIPKIRSTSSQCVESGDAVSLLDTRSRRGVNVGSDHSLSSARDLQNQVESLERS
ncbi:unnamed protein product [Heterobilharzia americana]|nr:unnamed protein product [Heterobilharzia americana]